MAVRILFILISIALIGFVYSKPQRPIYVQPTVSPYQPRTADEAPAPYDFNYKVDNPPTATFFGQNEAGDASGRVAGSYYVYLPDGRLMTVDYTVDGQSGFLPRISFSNQAPPTGVGIVPIRGTPIIAAPIRG